MRAILIYVVIVYHYSRANIYQAKFEKCALYVEIKYAPSNYNLKTFKINQIFTTLPSLGQLSVSFGYNRNNRILYKRYKIKASSIINF